MSTTGPTAGSAFDPDEVAELLARCHRCCPICHRFAGVAMVVVGVGGRSHRRSASIRDAVPLCAECHAGMRCLDPDHPLARPYSPRELRAHKAQWLEICARNPDTVVAAPLHPPAPLTALLAELELNREAADPAGEGRERGPFRDEAFRRVIATGTLAAMLPALRTAVGAAYRTIARAERGPDREAAARDVRACVSAALQALRERLGVEPEGGPPA